MLQRKISWYAKTLRAITPWERISVADITDCNSESHFFHFEVRFEVSQKRFISFTTSITSQSKELLKGKEVTELLKLKNILLMEETVILGISDIV